MHPEREWSEYDNDEQFEIEIKSLCKLASARSHRYRERFSNTTRAFTELSELESDRNSLVGWRGLDFAIMAALSGNIGMAEKTLSVVQDGTIETETDLKIQSSAQEVRMVLGDSGELRQLLEAKIRETRRMLKLAKFDGALLPAN